MKVLDATKPSVNSSIYGLEPCHLKHSGDIEAVAAGLRAIFPSLTRAGYNSSWRELRAYFFVGGSPEMRSR